jgi:flavin reductase (DIM6/NTAB) family NADH-FMN oxidoreductase RutF
MYENVELSLAYRVLGNGRTVILTTYDPKRQIPNAMAVAWNIIISKEPPLAGFMLGKSHYTYQLIQEEGEFSVSLPSPDMARLVMAIGKDSGRNMDKFITCGIDAMESEIVTAPSIHGCPAHLEFKVEKEVDFGQSALIIGRAVAARTREAMFKDGMWQLNEKTAFIHHLGEANFAISNSEIRL